MQKGGVGVGGEVKMKVRGAGLISPAACMIGGGKGKKRPLLGASGPTCQASARRIVVSKKEKIREGG